MTISNFRISAQNGPSVATGCGSLMLWTALLLAAQPLQAQDSQVAPIPDPLPSVDSYSLPPGPAAPVENQVQGPVDEDTSPPQRILATPSAPAQTEAIQPERRSESEPGSPVTTVPAGPSRADQGAAPSGTATAGRAIPASVPETVDASPVAESPVDPPEPGFNALPPSAQPVASPDQPDFAADPGKQTGETSLFLIGGGITLFLLGIFGFMLWKRQRLDANSAPTSLRRSVRDPQPGSPMRQPSGGLVTGKSRTKTRQVAVPQPAAFTSHQRSDHLHIAFVAEHASTTLLNAVLAYRITLTNHSEQDISNIRLMGAMVQADESAISHDAALCDAELHQIARLKAGESTSMAGELRLALNAIFPFQVQQHPLFVPLARFGVEYASQESAVHQQTAAYIIGREHQPPRPKMAPFRLDLGPCNFNPVGQRSLVTS